MNTLSLQSGGGGDAPEQTKLRRRRPPDPAEHERRKAWGRLWGEVMHQHAVEKGWKK